MEHWHLVVLGKPFATYGERRIENLPNRSLWGILASLVTPTIPITRSVLEERFWRDGGNPSQSLRSGLSILRKTFSPELVTPELRLTKGTTCDLTEFRALVKQAASLPDSQARRPLLEEAALYLNGQFLDGCETGQAFDWVQQSRAVICVEMVKALEMLFHCQKEEGDQVALFDTIQRILHFDPDHKKAQQELLCLSTASTKRLNFKMNWFELTEETSKSQFILHEDRITLEILLNKKLGELSSEVYAQFLNLAVFPNDFTLDQAKDIAGLKESDIFDLARLNLIQETNQKERLTLTPAIQNALWRKLTGEQRRRLKVKYASWFMSWVSQLPNPHPHLEVISILETETRNIKETIFWLLNQIPTEQGVNFLRWLWETSSIFHKEILLAEPYLELSLNISHSDPETTQFAFLLIVQFKQSKHQFSDAAALITGYENTFYRSPHLTECFYQHLLIAYHNSGNDSSFDITVTKLMEHYHQNPEREFPSPLYHSIAENLLARRMFSEALPYNDNFLSFSKSIGSIHHRAAAHFQRGVILNGLGRADEARFSWNEALMLFEDVNNAHGMGQCLEALAILYLQAGALAEARRTLSQAMEFYQTSGDEAAVYAAHACLGDIYRERGEINNARTAYEEGLTFWQERQHARWITKFQTRLDILQDSTGKILL